MSPGGPASSFNDCVKLGTWNVRSLMQSGKLANVVLEMESLQIDVLGISETFWEGKGDFLFTLPDQKNQYRVIYSGGSKRRKGVALVLNQKAAHATEYFETISERLIILRLNAKPVPILIVQVYAPVEDEDDEIKDIFYEEVNSVIKRIKKHQECLIVMGDLNAKVGSQRESNIVGPFGLGMRNSNGEKLIDFCREQNLCLTNTWFQQKESARHTWISPDGQTKNQIDFIAVSNRFRNSIKNSKVRPGADCGSDHNLVAASVKIRFKRIKRTVGKKRWNINLMEDSDLKKQFQVETENKLKDVESGNAIDSDTLWENIKSCVAEVADTLIKSGKHERKQQWMTEDILALMKERKKYKNAQKTEDRAKYKDLHHKIQKMCREAKNRYFDSKCRELEELDKQRNPLFYRKIKEFTYKPNNSYKGVRNEEGNIITNDSEITERWAEYVDKLYADERSELPEQNTGEKILITEEEIKNIITKLPDKKAAGVDEIPAELIKQLGEQGISILTKLINKIYKSGKIPGDFLKCIFVPIPKVAYATDCDDFRLISLISHASKILLQVIKRRIEPIIETHLSDSQMGFRKNKGTRDAILQLRTISERLLQVEKRLYICYIDFKKAFDRVKHNKLMEVMVMAGIPSAELNLIQNLYWHETAVVKTGNNISNQFHIRKGVRQGCILSPILFNLYSEYLITEAIGDSKGVAIGGINFNNTRYADDTAIIAEHERELQDMITKLEASCKNYGMEMNLKKTKVMVIAKKPGTVCNIMVNGIKLEQVKDYKYLGSWITEDGKCEKDIQARIGQAKDAFWKQKELLRSNLKLGIKVRILQTYVFSICSYACETWTLNASVKRRINAFEMWCYRRILRISWKDRRSNAEVLQKMKTKRRLLPTIVKRKLQFAGHILRGSGGLLSTAALEGRINGRRGRGRPRRNWIDDVREWTGIYNYGAIKRKAEDRVLWRNMAANPLI